MKTLIIGDLHLNGNDPKYLQSQIDFFDEITKINFDSIIFLGDIFHYRSPKVIELLAFKKIIIKIANSKSPWQANKDISILVGNHDYVDRETDITALTLFGDTYRNSTDRYWVRIITTKNSGFGYYSYTEDIQKLREQLNEDNSKIIYGHFGYNGLLAPEGFDESGLTLADFKKFKHVFLGHIHHHSVNENVCVVGTPYTTSFSEAGKKSYVALLDYKGNYELIETTTGPRHHVLDEINLDTSVLSEKNYNVVKVISDSMDYNKIRKQIPDFVTNLILEPRVAKIGHDKYWTGSVNQLHTYLDHTQTDLDKVKLLKTLDDVLEDCNEQI